MAKLKVSSVHRFVEAFSGETVWLGIDVHKLSFSVALLRPDGVVKDWTCPADVPAITQLIASLPVQVGAVCYESGPTGFGLARSLESADIRTIVAAPSRIPRPITATNKTDSLDCRKLAELAVSGLLRPIAIPSIEDEAFRALERRRHQLTDSLRRVKQRIRSLLLFLGKSEPASLDHWSKAAINALHQMELFSGAKDTLESLLDELS